MTQEANMDGETNELEQCPGRVPVGGRRFCYEGCPDWRRVQDRLDCPGHLKLCDVCEQKVFCPCHVPEARDVEWEIDYLAWRARTEKLPPLRSTILRPLH